ncbi:MAG: ABC transporter permease [Phycisphaerae bacterium]|nr:ABC transporter permease [Phycisphaerae bacterium]
MFLIRLFITALRSLDTNFLRSVLATLGVVIGVMSVISAMSILEGARKDILDKFQTLGSNVLFVMPAEKKLAGRIVGLAETLRINDVTTLKSECPEIDLAAPVVFAPQIIKYFSKSVRVPVFGTTHDYAALNGYKLDSGRFMSPEESNAENNAVAVLGYSVADKLFSGMEPIGQPVKIGNKGFRVIGVLRKQGAVGMDDVDNSVFVPVRTGMKRILRQRYLHRIVIKSRDPQRLNQCEQEVRKILRRAHKVRAGEEEDFRIFNQQQMLTTFNEVTTIFAAVFYSIAGISLVVGGIGITNIMLVSVTERTREIGVRIAVGARRGDILFQFMVEALVISTVGGAGGVLMGLMFASGLEAIMPGVIQTHTPPKVIVWALTVAVVVGLASGIYPAYKASRKDPVEALRYE